MRDNDFSQPMPTPAGTTTAVKPRDLHYPLTPGERSCCCPSRPAVRVILPSTSQRNHCVDLLLCAHHYRRSSTALADAGAQVFDGSGTLLCTGERKSSYAPNS